MINADKIKTKFFKRKKNCTDPGQLLRDWPVNEDINITDANWHFLGLGKPFFTDTVLGKAYITFPVEAEAMSKFKELNPNLFNCNF